ncbi:MAG TPA: T9SS type A sorting domain-containing protein, partial [Flavobacterium sp.]
GNFNIKSSTGMELMIHNNLGQSLYECKLNQSNEFEQLINVSLPAGIYYLSEKSNENNTQKLLIR